MEKAERRYRDAVQALTSLEGGGYQARLAGGCVRDRLLGGETGAPSDYDIATTAKPEEVIRHFHAAGRRTVPTGVDHGTVTLLMPAAPIEITTLRTDVATDGRHAQVAYGTSFEEDAERRDFTINAMFEDARGTVYDYFTGKADLDARVLRFVGDAATRIREDYLRILRFFRFWSRLGFTPAPGTLAAVEAHKGGLAQISQERITAELIKTLAGEHARIAVEAMAKTGILATILPEFGAPGGASKVPPEAAFAAWRGAAPAPGLAVLAGLAAVMGPLSDAAIAALALRLKLATADQRRLAFAAFAATRLRSPFVDLAARLDFVDAAETAGGAGSLGDFYAPVLSTDVAATTALAAVLSDDLLYGERRRAKLPLDGVAVAAALGIAPGPALGVALAELKRAYRNGTWSTREAGLAWLARRASGNFVK